MVLLKVAFMASLTEVGAASKARPPRSSKATRTLCRTCIADCSGQLLGSPFPFFASCFIFEWIASSTTVVGRLASSHAENWSRYTASREASGFFSMSSATGTVHANSIDSRVWQCVLGGVGAMERWGPGSGVCLENDTSCLDNMTSCSNNMTSCLNNMTSRLNNIINYSV